jgi:hypothetical protein
MCVVTVAIVPSLGFSIVKPFWRYRDSISTKYEEMITAHMKSNFEATELLLAIMLMSLTGLRVSTISVSTIKAICLDRSYLTESGTAAPSKGKLEVMATGMELTPYTIKVG